MIRYSRITFLRHSLPQLAFIFYIQAPKVLAYLQDADLSDFGFSESARTMLEGMV